MLVGSASAADVRIAAVDPVANPPVATRSHRQHVRRPGHAGAHDCRRRASGITSALPAAVATPSSSQSKPPKPSNSRAP